MLENDRNKCCNLSPSRPAKARDTQRSETPRGASETPIARLARTRVSLKTDCALAVLGACQEQYETKPALEKKVVDWPSNALRNGPQNQFTDRRKVEQIECV